MKRKIGLSAAVLSVFIFSGVVFAEQWKQEKSTHFIINYQEADQQFVRDVVQHAERYYDRIATELGFTRFKFWLWDNRAQIFIYDDASAYQAATGNPSWSGGAASAYDKIIFTFVGAQDFLSSILPHEMGHIIFREFVGSFNPAVPLWLEEGVASYQEKAKYSGARSAIKEAVRNERDISLDELTSSGALLLLDRQQAFIFYAQAFTIVDFLIREYGSDRFVYFCQNLRDKQNLDRAISSAYPLEGLGGLAQAWRKWVQR